MKKSEIEKSDIRAIAAELKTSLLSIFCCGLLFAMLGFMLVGIIVRPVYTSSSNVVVTVRGQLSMTSSGLARSSSIAEMLADVVNDNEFELLLKKGLDDNIFSGKISAELVKDTNFIKLSASASDPMTAYRYVNRMIDCYSELLERTAPDAMLTVFETPKLPNTPKQGMSEFVGALIGFALGVGIMAFYVGRRTVKSGVIRNSTGLEKSLGVPVIAGIPFEKKHKKGKSILIDNISCSFSYVEQIKKLRTRIEAEAESKNAKVILFLSCFESEGKSTISSNLSIALAKKNRRVLLCDFDLRNPSVHKIFGIDQITEVDLKKGGSGGGDLPVIELPDHGISVLSYERSIFGGTLSEMIEGARKAVDSFKDKYDYIVIDTSPAMRTPETYDFSEMADMTVLVIRENNVSKESAKRVVDNLKNSTDVVVCVLNYTKNRMSSKLKDRNSYYGLKNRGYGYKYGYGYGYKYKRGYKAENK